VQQVEKGQPMPLQVDEETIKKDQSPIGASGGQIKAALAVEQALFEPVSRTRYLDYFQTI
jgi:hypothetical protein